MRHLLFACALYELPILRPIAAAAYARGSAVCWFVSWHLARFLQAGEQRVIDARAARRWHPDSVVSACNWVPHFFPGLKVQVFHGFNVDKRSESRGHFRIRGLFDFHCSQWPATTAPFLATQRALGHFCVIGSGWSELDPLFDASLPASVQAAARARYRRLRVDVYCVAALFATALRDDCGAHCTR